MAYNQTYTEIRTLLKQSKRVSKQTMLKIAKLAIKETIMDRLIDEETGKEIEITWNKIMDKLIVDRTNGIYCKNLNVFIKIDSSPLKNELNISKEKILQKLKRYHNKIENIIFL